jgi:hypothetical protein
MKIRPIAHAAQTADNPLEDKVVVDGLRVFQPYLDLTKKTLRAKFFDH